MIGAGRVGGRLNLLRMVGRWRTMVYSTPSFFEDGGITEKGAKVLLM